MQEGLQGRLGRLVSPGAEAEGVSNFRDDERGVADSGEFDEGDSAGEVVLHLGRHREPQARLADPARPGQSDQADGRIKHQRGDGCDVALSSDERRQGNG